MAVTQEEKTTKVALRVNVGTQGDPSYKNRTFNYVNPALTDDLAYSTFAALGEFQDYTVTKIVRTDAYTLESDE